MLAYLEQRRAAAPKDQQPALLGALARAYKARDGHFHGLLPLLESEAAQPSSGHTARRLLHEVKSLPPLFDRSVARLAGELTVAASHRGRELATPRRLSGGGPPRAALPTVGAPRRPDYEVRLETLATPPRPRLKAPPETVRLRPPEVPRARVETPAAVTKPRPTLRPSAARLAAALFTQAYQTATELAGQGLVESAKAEYATLMQLFPDSPQAQQAARYALNLFQRERGAARGADALAAYLQWIRAVLGPAGSDYAERLAFRHLADDAEPAILAREAEEFLKRHPDSKWCPEVRLQLAVALDHTGATARAIEVLKPLASPLDDAQRVKAAHILAWLHIFQGEAAPARQVLEALAAQTVTADVAADARRTLQAMAANPLPKLVIGEVVGAEDPDEALATALLQVADRQLEKGDDERALDLYEVYLRVARESQTFRITRDRIQRIKRTGRADEE